MGEDQLFHLLFLMITGFSGSAAVQNPSQHFWELWGAWRICHYVDKSCSWSTVQVSKVWSHLFWRGCTSMITGREQQVRSCALVWPSMKIFKGTGNTEQLLMQLLQCSVSSQKLVSCQGRGEHRPLFCVEILMSGKALVLSLISGVEREHK